MKKLDPKEHKFLSHLFPLVEKGEIYSFGLDNFTRRNADGLWTLLVKRNGYHFGIIYNDFKVNGGSFGKEVCTRANEFITYLDENSYPLTYLVNSIGVRIMEGRGVFNDAFKLIPKICDFKSKNLFITANIGKSLGLGALVLSLGHYRLSLREDSEINLTGPEVIKMFFGKTVDFTKISSPERHQHDTGLIHEITEDKKDLFERLLNFLDFKHIKPKYHLHKKREVKDLYQLETPEERVQSLIVSISDSHKEVFSQLDETVRTFLINRNGTYMGVVVNPLGHYNNMINISTLEKYSAALSFFDALKVPVVSFLDTPGANPLNATIESKEVINLLRDVAV